MTFFDNVSDECLFFRYPLDSLEPMPSCSTLSNLFPEASQRQSLTSTPWVYLVNTSLTVNIGIKEIAM